MMKPAENWYCCDMADLLRVPKIRHILVDSLEAQGDRDQAIRNVCRLYGVKPLDALPGAIRAATLALLDD